MHKTFHMNYFRKYNEKYSSEFEIHKMLLYILADIYIADFVIH